MSLIEDREKRFLFEWAKSVGKKGFQENKKSNSLFETFDNTGNIVEFEFSDVSEFENMLKSYLGRKATDDLIRCCSVAAFKRKPNNEEVSDAQKQNEIDIPDFVYAF